MNKILLGLILILAASPALAYNATLELEPGIMAYWKADSLSWVDSTGNYVNGVAYGDAAGGASGQINNSWSFDGSGDYVTTNVNINNQENGTISAWFNLTDNSTSRYIISGHSGGNDFHIGCAPNNLQFYEQDSGTTLSGDVCQKNEFVHVVGTWGNNGRLLYVNGVLVNESVYTGPANAPTNLHIGITAGTTSQPWEGTLDEIGLWSRQLSQSDIELIYSLGNGCTYPFYNCTVNNSLTLTAIDEINGNSLNNVSVLITGPETRNKVINGSYTFLSLNNGTYSLRASKEGYGTLTTDDLIVSELGETNYTFYMSSESNKVIFYIKNINDDEIVGASIKVTRVNDGISIGSKYTDLAGSAFFYLDESTTYNVNLTYPGYADYYEEINPVLSSYTIRLDQLVNIEDSPDYTGVGVYFTPKNYYTTRQNNFSISFSSPEAVLTNYFFNVSHPGGSDEQTGTSASGETFQYNFTPVGASAGDYVTVRYGYDTTIGGWRNFTYSYRMEAPYNESSFLQNKGETYGLGVLERMLIVTLITVVVAGTAALLGGVFVGGSIGLLLLGFFAYIGFVPVWAVLISLTVGFLWVAWRGSGG